MNNDQIIGENNPSNAYPTCTVWVAILSLVFTVLFSPISQSATVSVNSTADGASGGCPLRKAINSINLATTQPGCSEVGVYGDMDTIDFNFVGPGPFTIVLTAGQLEITKPVTITGIDSDLLIIDGNLSDRVFFVNNADNVTISFMTITRGRTVSTPAFDEKGGGIYASTSDNLKIVGAIITNNESLAFGGGILVENSFGFELLSSQVLNNVSPLNAGVDLSGSTVNTISNSIISGNRSTRSIGGVGGGLVLFNSAGPPGNVILDTTISDNHSEGGNGHAGGVEIFQAGDTRFIRSTISGNSATGEGGGIRIRGNTGEVVYFINSTVSGNTAGTGGGIHGSRVSTNPYVIALVHATIYDNNATNTGGVFVEQVAPPNAVTVNNIGSIISNSTGGDCNHEFEFTVRIFPFFGDNSCSGVAFGNPQLGPLQNNPSGVTNTHAPAPGSPLLKASSSVHCSEVGGSLTDGLDQNQNTRASPCTIGAAERAVDESNFLTIPIPGNGSVIINF